MEEIGTIRANLSCFLSHADGRCPWIIDKNTGCKCKKKDKLKIIHREWIWRNNNATQNAKCWERGGDGGWRGRGIEDRQIEFLKKAVRRPKSMVTKIWISVPISFHYEIHRSEIVSFAKRLRIVTVSRIRHCCNAGVFNICSRSEIGWIADKVDESLLRPHGSMVLHCVQRFVFDSYSRAMNSREIHGGQTSFALKSSWNQTVWKKQ